MITGNYGTRMTIWLSGICIPSKLGKLCPLLVSFILPAVNAQVYLQGQFLLAYVTFLDFEASF